MVEPLTSASPSETAKSALRAMYREALEDKELLALGKPITNAERQKRYREKLGDEYRKRNRERMREKRK